MGGVNWRVGDKSINGRLAMTHKAYESLCMFLGFSRDKGAVPTY